MLRRFGRTCVLFVIVAAIAASVFGGTTLRIADLVLLFASAVAAHYWARLDENRRAST
jgi:hypothetical protein